MRGIIELLYELLGSLASLLSPPDPSSRDWGLGWILPPLSNSWIIDIIGLYIALNRTPNIDCYWVRPEPKV